MDYPKGFKELVGRVRKGRRKKAKGKDIWYKYCKIALIGKGRYDAETSFLLNMLKDYFKYEYVMKKTGDQWRDEIRNFLEKRLEKIRDKTIKSFISDLIENLFKFSATVRGGARFFKKKKLFKNINNLTKNKKKTWDLVKQIVEDRDVPGISYAKAILWLHSTGRAKNLAPPTAQLKKFLNNDIGPRHQYYRNDKFFMDRAEKMDQDFPKTKLIDIYRAIHLYKTLGIMLPRGCSFGPVKLLNFLDKENLSVKQLSGMLNNINKKEELNTRLHEFMGYSY